MTVTAAQLRPGDVLVVLGERLTVSAPPEIRGNVAVVATEAGVTVYLRAAGPAPLAGS
jgi:hypothetical protein